MPIDINAHSKDPNKAILSSPGKKPLEVKASRIANGALGQVKAVFSNALHTIIGKQALYTKKEVFDLRTRALPLSGLKATQAYLRCKDLSALERAELPNLFHNPMVKSPSQKTEKTLEVNPLLQKPSISVTPEKDPFAEDLSSSSNPTSPSPSTHSTLSEDLGDRGSIYSLDSGLSIFDKPPIEVLSPFPKPIDLDGKDKNIEARKQLGEILGIDLSEASFMEVMQALNSSPTFSQTDTHDEKIERNELRDLFIETEKYNRKENRPLTPLAKTSPKEKKILSLKVSAKTALTNLGRSFKTHNLHGNIEAKRLAFNQLLYCIQSYYSIDPDRDVMAKCRTADEAIKNTSVSELLIKQKKLDPHSEEYHLITRLIEVFKETFIQGF
jgi:hypothetical protein